MTPKLLRRYDAACARTGRCERASLVAGILILFVGVPGCTHSPKAKAAGPAGRVTKGPCLLRVGQDRVALMWETDAPGSAGVSYGEEGRLDAYREGTSEMVAYTGLTDGAPTTAYIHKVWLDGLQPGRTYSYRVTGPHVHGETFEFRTTPAATDEVRFIVYGDSRTQAQIHRRLVEQMMKHDVDFVVHGGDLVSRGDDYRLWGPQFFEPLQGLVERVPIYIAKGNHEGRGGTYERLLVPPGAENSFAIDFGPLHYFCTDNVSSRVGDHSLAARLVRDAQASPALWKFVSYHIPSVNFGGHRSDWQQSEVLDTFAAAGVDFAITAHSHQYERFRPVTAQAPGRCVTYITAGGGGAPLYPVESTACHACAKTIHHFCLFHIKGGHLTMDAIDPNGRVFDHLEITKEGGRLDDAYISTAIPAGGIRLHQLLYASLNTVPSGKPAANRPCTVSISLTVPPLERETRLTFGLRGDSRSYQLPEPHVITVGEKGGPVRIKLTCTPKVTVHPAKSTLGKAAPIEPALWVDCRYEFEGFQDTVSRPVMAQGKSLLDWMTGTGN